MTDEYADGLWQSLDDRYQAHRSACGDLQSLGSDDPQFVKDLRLFVRIIDPKPPIFEERIEEGTKLPRLLSQLRKSGIPKLDDKVIQIVWSWLDYPESFLRPRVATREGRSSPTLLSSVCTLLQQIEEENQVNAIRTRLLLYFLAQFVDERIQGIRSNPWVVTFLVQSGWIHPDLQATLHKRLKDWLSAGRKYVLLAKLLGLGAIIYLPFFSRSTWEHHCHLMGVHGREIESILRDMGLPEMADAVHNGRTGHDVVEGVMQHLFAQSPNIFVDYNTPNASGKAKSLGLRKPPRSQPPRRTQRTAPSTPHPPSEPRASRSPLGIRNTEPWWLTDSSPPAGSTGSAPDETGYCQVLPFIDPYLAGSSPQTAT